jgi:hypothetical protein
MEETLTSKPVDLQKKMQGGNTNMESQTTTIEHNKGTPMNNNKTQ